MKNKLLFVVVVILVPIVVILSINDKKESQQIEYIDKNIKVFLDYNNKQLELSLDDYLLGVVGMEMPASFNIEALKAQAIASRTFALSTMKNNEINTNTTSQSYGDENKLKEKWQEDYDKYINKIKECINETKDLVMKYDNKIIKSYYFSMSNGKTENVQEVFNEELPYLESVDSSFEENQNNFTKTTVFTYSNFCKLLEIDNCYNIKIDNIIKDSSNRVKTININDKLYTGIDVRKKLSLRSTDFEINILDNNIEITTKGYGHGVGMSQYGANYLANQGKNYEEILKYYYKDIKIEKI